MKKIFIIVIFSLCSWVGKAQQMPLFTQYLSNPYLVLPATAGMRYETNIKLTSRMSGLGIQGAPTSVFLTANTCLVQKGGFKHGIGISFFNDKAGLLGRTNANVIYSFHLPLNPSEGVYWATGFNMGIQSYNFDEAGKVVISPDDPVANTSFNANAIDGGVSSILYSPDFFIGLGSNLISSRQVKWFNSNKIDGIHQLMAGYRLAFADNKCGIVPSVLVRKVGTLLQYDASATFRVKDYFWTGITYRGKQGIAMMLGAGGKNFNFTYSYDYFKQSGFSGFHEITFGVRFAKKANRDGEPYRYKPKDALRVPTLW